MWERSSRKASSAPSTTPPVAAGREHIEGRLDLAESRRLLDTYARVLDGYTYLG